MARLVYMLRNINTGKWVPTKSYRRPTNDIQEAKMWHALPNIRAAYNFEERRAPGRFEVVTFELVEVTE